MLLTSRTDSGRTMRLPWTAESTLTIAIRVSCHCAKPAIHHGCALDLCKKPSGKHETLSDLYEAR